MNKFLNYFTTAALILALAIFASCGSGGDDPVEEIDPCETLATTIVKTATVSKVTSPQSVETATWSGFTLTFTGDKDGGSFTTNVQSIADAQNDQSLLNIWAANGTWSFVTCTNAKVLIKSAQLSDREASLAASSTKMTLTFDVPQSDTGRTMGIPGTWVFEFSL